MANDLIEVNERILDVLRHDYQMLYRLAADRLAALDAAFPRRRLPIESQTGLSWRRLVQMAYHPDPKLDVPEGLTPNGDVAKRPGWDVIPEFSEPSDVGHPI